MRRHPTARALAAWFDGEDVGDQRDHVAGCERCRRRVHELGRVRAVVRGETIPAPLGRARRGWVPIAAPAALALVGALLLATSPGTLRAPFRMARDLLDPSGDTARRGGPPTSVALGRPGRPSAPDGAQGQAPSKRPIPPTSTPAASRTSLRLAVIVPATGPDSTAGAEVVTAVRRVVDGANRTGGVGGRPVQLVVVAAEDDAEVAGLRSRADVAVGGFGATPPVPWVLPADAAGDGAIVAAEATPYDAGALLGADMVRRGIRGEVGVVIGPGPDASLADGLARAVPVTSVAAGGDGCDGAVRELRGRLVSALAVAGPPDVARRCLEAAARLGWRPPGGVVLPPSAGYAGIHLAPYALGTRTVLGVPWPSSEEPGAARFRSAMGAKASYRAIVSFAAAELAIAAARSGEPFRAEALLSGSWHTDLVAIESGINRSAAVVVASGDGWRASPPRSFANN
jgi:hypothetical protein